MFSVKIMCCFKYYQEAHGGVHRHEYSFHGDTLHPALMAFSGKNYALHKILSGGILMSGFIKEPCDEV
jgi:hypothetical protein